MTEFRDIKFNRKYIWIKKSYVTVFWLFVYFILGIGIYAQLLQAAQWSRDYKYRFDRIDKSIQTTNDRLDKIMPSCISGYASREKPLRP